MAALARICSEYPYKLSSSESEVLLSSIRNWSIQHGLAVRPATSFVPRELDPSNSLAVTAPVTLFPSLFPIDCFEEAKAVQSTFNELYARIAADEDWLGKVIEEYVRNPQLFLCHSCPLSIGVSLNSPCASPCIHVYPP